MVRFGRGADMFKSGKLKQRWHVETSRSHRVIHLPAIDTFVERTPSGGAIFHKRHWLIFRTTGSILVGEANINLRSSELFVVEIGPFRKVFPRGYFREYGSGRVGQAVYRGKRTPE